MKITRRLRMALSVILACSMPAVFAADAYPTKQVTVIVPQGPGGANDTIARIVAQKLGDVLGTTVIVENRAGAGGNIGTVAAARAAADGYTLMLTTNSAQVINPALYKSPGFDPVKDFTPVASVATAGYVLVANPSFPPNNLAELSTYLKNRSPNEVAYASSGNGTLNHLIGEMLIKAIGSPMVHIPYKSAAAAATDVVGGQVPLSVQSLPSSIAFIKTGKLKVLGTVNEKRVNALPNVPTLAETKPGLASNPWYGLLAPAGTPQAVVTKLQEATKTALASPDVIAALEAQGCEPYYLDSSGFASLIEKDLASWARIVKESGASVN